MQKPGKAAACKLHGCGFTQEKTAPVLAADNSQCGQHKHDLKYDDLGPASKKMINDSAPDDCGNSRVNQYAEFTGNIHIATPLYSIQIQLFTLQKSWLVLPF